MFQESRLLHFNEAGDSPLRDVEVPAATRDATDVTTEKRERRPEVSQEMNRILGLDAPGQDLAQMNDDDYTKKLMTGRLDELIPDSEAARDMRLAIQGMEEDMRHMMSSMGTNPEDMSFEQIFSTVGRSIDKHFRPLMVKYHGHEDELLRGMVQFGVRERMQRDRDFLTRDPSGKVSNPVPELISAIERGKPNSYDRLLQKELASGKTLSGIRADYEKMQKEAGEGSTDGNDAEGILKAVDRLMAKSKTALKKLMREDILKKFPKGVTFAIDPNDGEIVLQISGDEMASFIKESPDAERLPNGNMKITVNGKPIEIRYDMAENAYEVAM